jgi:hypothetical protein
MVEDLFQRENSELLVVNKPTLKPSINLLPHEKSSSEMYTAEHSTGQIGIK